MVKASGLLLTIKIGKQVFDMKLDRVGNTKRNIVVGEIDKFMSILLPFIVRTMMIHLLGAEYLGLTSLFYSILQMLNLVEMGFGTSIVYSMYKPIAENDKATINALYKFYAKIYRIIGIIMGVLGLMLMPFLPYLMKDDAPTDINVYVVYIIYILNSSLNCFLFPNRRAVISAYQREDVNALAHIETQTVMYILQMLAVGMARSYYLYVLTVPAFTVGYALMCARQFKKLFPDYHEEGELSEEIRQDIKKQVIGLMIRRVAYYSRNAFDSMFISAYMGLGLAAVYGNYYYIMDAIVMVLGVIKTAMAGGVGNSIAMETEEKNMADMLQIDFMFMVISGWCSICLLCLYQPFMKIWVGSKMMLPMYMAVTFSVYFYILMMGEIRMLYYESVGIWWQGRYLSIIEAVSNILLNWIFVKNWGIFGIVLATMISYGVFNLIGGVVLLYKHYFVSYKMQKYFVNQIKYLIITMCVGVATYFVSKQIGVEGILGILLKGLVCVIIPGVIYFLIYFKTEEFKKSLGFVKIIKNGNK